MAIKVIITACHLTGNDAPSCWNDILHWYSDKTDKCI